MKRILLSCVTCLLALGLVAACDTEDEEGEEPEVPGTVVDEGGDGDENPSQEIEPEISLSYAEVDEIVDGGVYYFGFLDSSELYLFNGTTDSYGDYLQCSVAGQDDFEPIPLKVSITEADPSDDAVDTIGLTFTLDETEYTVYAWPSSSTSGDKTTQYGEITFIETSLLDDETDGPKEDAVTEFTWDAERGTLAVTLTNGDWYFSTYQSKSAISLTSTSNSYDASHFYTSVEVSSIKVSVEETSMVLGQSLQLTTAIGPENSYPDVIWSSSDDSVAAVDSSGLVRGLGTGTAAITVAPVGNYSIADSVTITVTERGVAVYQESETIVPGDYYSYVTASSLDLTSQTTYGSLVDITYADNGGSTKPQYYVNGAAIRIYALNTVTFTPVNESVATISSVAITYNGSYFGNDNAEVTDGNNLAGSVSKDTSSKTLTLSFGESATSGVLTYINYVESEHTTKSGGTQLRIESITINYAQPTA